MNILLIKPYWPYPYSKGEDTYNRIRPPLSLANCAAILKKEGYNAKILDAHAQRIKPYKITNYVKGYDKIFVTLYIHGLNGKQTGGSLKVIFKAAIDLIRLKYMKLSRNL